MNKTTSLDVPSPKYKEIGDTIAMLLLEAKTQGHDQETTRAALQAFSNAVTSAPSVESERFPRPF